MISDEFPTSFEDIDGMFDSARGVSDVIGVDALRRHLLAIKVPEPIEKSQTMIDCEERLRVMYIGMASIC